MKKKTSTIIIISLLAAILIGLIVFALVTDEQYGFGDVAKVSLSVIAISVVFGKLLTMGNVNKKQMEKYAQDYKHILKSAFTADGDKTNYKALMQAIHHYNKRQYAKSVKKLDRLLPRANTKDDKCAVMIFYALSESFLKHYDKSVELYKSALKLDKTRSTAWSNLGLIHQGQGRLKEAVKCFQNAITHAPENPHAYNNLGNTYYDLKDYTSAIENGEKALELKSDLYQSAYLLCLSYFQLGNKEKSEEYFDIAVENGGNATLLRGALEVLAEKQA